MCVGGGGIAGNEEGVKKDDFSIPWDPGNNLLVDRVWSITRS